MVEWVGPGSTGPGEKDVVAQPLVSVLRLREESQAQHRPLSNSDSAERLTGAHRRSTAKRREA